MLHWVPLLSSFWLAPPAGAESPLALVAPAGQAPASAAGVPGAALAAGGMVTALLVVGAYHLAFAARQRDARENLYFSALCGLLALYTASSATVLAAAMEHRVSPLRLGVAALLASGPLYLGLLTRLLRLTPTRVAHAVVGLCAAGVAAAMLLPGAALPLLDRLAHAAVVAGVLASVAWAARYPRSGGAWAVLPGMAALGAALAWDLLAGQGLVPAAELLAGVPGLFWLGFLAFVGAVGVRTAGSFAEAELAARTDPLTGLTRRHVFEDALAREAERRRRSGGTLILVVLDLDHFKRVNDTHGHRAGDLVLERAGHLFRHNARNIDLTARLGGEEFAALLHDTDLDGGLTFVNRFRQRLAALEIQVPGGVVAGLTASVGIALSSGWVDTDTLIDAADRAMYQAKRAGRDRVVTVTLNEVGREEGIGKRE